MDRAGDGAGSAVAAGFPAGRVSGGECGREHVKRVSGRGSIGRPSVTHYHR